MPRHDRVQVACHETRTRGVVTQAAIAAALALQPLPGAAVVQLQAVGALPMMQAPIAPINQVAAQPPVMPNLGPPIVLQGLRGECLLLLWMFLEFLLQLVRLVLYENIFWVPLIAIYYVSLQSDGRPVLPGESDGNDIWALWTGWVFIAGFCAVFGLGLFWGAWHIAQYVGGVVLPALWVYIRHRFGL